jgi:hypothetical protein
LKVPSTHTTGSAQKVTGRRTYDTYITQKRKVPF